MQRKMGTKEEGEEDEVERKGEGKWGEGREDGRGRVGRAGASLQEIACARLGPKVVSIPEAQATR